jgi:hypothetical protein
MFACISTTLNWILLQIQILAPLQFLATFGVNCGISSSLVLKNTHNVLELLPITI